MATTVKQIVQAILYAVIAVLIAENTNRQGWLVTFVTSDIPPLLPAFVGINLTALAAIGGQIASIRAKTGTQSALEKTMASLRRAVAEHIALIIIAFGLCLLPHWNADSRFTHFNWGDLRTYTVTLLTACYFYATMLLYDSYTALFQILDFNPDGNTGN